MQINKLLVFTMAIVILSCSIDHGDIEIAEEIGQVKTANMVALGAYIGKSKIIPFKRLEESLSNVFSKVKKELLDVNTEALKRGEEIGRKS